MVLVAAGAACIFYCLLVLGFLATTPDHGLRCLIGEDNVDQYGSGVTVYESPADLLAGRHPPAESWTLRSLAGRRIRTSVDFFRVWSFLRSPPEHIIGHL